MATDVLRQHVLPKLDRIRAVGGGAFKASCPVPGHGQGKGDRNPSLSITVGRDQPVVFNCKATCDQEAVKAALIARGIDWKLCSERRENSTVDNEWLPCHTDHGQAGHELVAQYDYRDIDGSLVYAKTRCRAKCFAQWRPDPTSKSGRRWRLTLPDGSRVGAGLLYRLPELRAALNPEMLADPTYCAPTVWFTEGEKDCDRLRSVGLVATTSGPVGSWTDAHVHWLTGADVIIVADRDQPGWKHVEAVANGLMPAARSIEIRRAAAGKDASDHLDAGHRIHNFVTVAEPKPAPEIGTDGRDILPAGAQ